MIKKINIKYPFLELEREFKKGLNIIEEENGYGKSTILNTIMSAYTFKYPTMRTLPEGSATIELDKDKFILSKKNWIGTTHEINDLYQYTMPGKFFDIKATTEQRKVIVDLLGLDYNTFMIEECNKAKTQFALLEWKEDLESDIKAKIKDSQTRSDIIIEDVMRLKSKLINFEEKDFKDIERYFEDKKNIEDKVKEYNRGIIDRQTKFNSLSRELDRIKSDISFNTNAIEGSKTSIKNLDNTISLLRDEWTKTNTNATCDKCGSKLEGEAKQSVLDGIKQTANKTKETLDKLQNDITNYHKQIKDLELQLESKQKEIDSFDNSFEMLSYDDLVKSAIKLDLDIVIPKKERLDEYNEYSNSLSERKQIEQELAYKEGQIKDINILVLQNNLDKLLEIKSLFTKKLEDATKDLPLDIQLFEILKNGNIKETFTINYKGTDYYDLSTGNKSIVNIMLAKLFVDKLGIDFILIDEGGLISKNNIDYIKDLSKDYQVILAKPTGWTSKDFK